MKKREKNFILSYTHIPITDGSHGSSSQTILSYQVSKANKETGPHLTHGTSLQGCQCLQQRM